MEDNRTSAPFNMAVATLMRLDGILQRIEEISARIISSSHNATDDINIICRLLELKKREIKQFFINAYPLLKLEQRERLKTKWNKIQDPIKYNSNFKIGAKEFLQPHAFRKYENLLDDFLCEVQEELQTEKYFMPPKQDLRTGWQQ